MVEKETTGERECNEALYWFKEHWLQKLYLSGIEGVTRELEKCVPFRYTDGEGTKTDAITMPFYWQPIWQGNGFKTEVGFPVLEVAGYRLFATTGQKGTYEPVVDVKKDGASGVYRLYASKHFEAGEAVIFLSEFEESSERLIFGGCYAKSAESQKDSNVYLSTNRVLRSTRSVKAGEEIIRWRHQSHDSFMENIDRVVLSQESMKVGRIGKLVTAKPGQSVVHYNDGSQEYLDRQHVDLFRNSKIFD